MTRTDFLIIFFCFIFIFLKYQNVKSLYKEGDLIRIATRVTTEPIVFDDKQYLNIKSLKVYLDRYPKIEYGDNVVVEGLVENGRLKNPKLISHDTQKPWLYNFRQTVIKKFKKTLPEPHASLLAGITLGSKQMPESFWQVLQETGTAHVVVASGTNITLLVSVLLGSLLHFIKRKKAVFIVVAVICLYVFLSGLDAPIVRAAIMAVVVLFGQIVGRETSTIRILIYTLTSMLLFNPLWIFDLGFILSFAATTSLLLFQKRVDSLFGYIPSIFREGITTSLSAQIGVLPIIYFVFGQFNPISPIINGLLLWTIPYIMILGLISTIIVFLPVTILPIYMAYPFLYYFVEVVELFS